MSYDIELLNKEGKRYTIEPTITGGTQELGGNISTWINITYNYSWYYQKYLDKEKGIRWLYNRKAKDCITKLETAISKCENPELSEDYWKATEGNCIRPLKILLDWCRRFPEGVFDGD